MYIDNDEGAEPLSDQLDRLGRTLQETLRLAILRGTLVSEDYRYWNMWYEYRDSANKSWVPEPVKARREVSAGRIDQVRVP